MKEDTDATNNGNSNAKPFPSWFFIIMFMYGTVIFAIFIILPAWEWAWIEGWIYLFLFMGITVVFYYKINKNDPRVIRNRMKIKKSGVTDEIKKEAGSDKWLLVIIGPFAFSTWILPGLDRNFGWSTMPFALEIIGFLFVTIGVVMFNIAQSQNAFASKVLDINEGQKLIDTGLYAHVRHPLYSGVIIWFLATPFALGSWYTLIPAIIWILGLIVRIKYEEEMLVKGMEGYKEYKTRVKYKILPKIY